MNSARFAAALLVAIGTSSALVVAAPAQADPTDEQTAQLDQTFLNAVSDKGVKFKTDAAAIDLAHSTCDVLVRTSSVENALRHIQNETEWKDLKKIQTFGSLAVRAYCPTALPKQ
ncbi:DUF732 domain-containing protein [Mycolicibacterium sp. 050158]|jgi:Protein of unknown function (DUF732)|uniref:DUF732 domain-containing protein n=1 Tax=Mycolicibacterium sp. 050158 TaxID=3090602 RepID=UPI00299E9EDC|nr:DUF732 domain-containing protein [Mycolicibacterium sp. 050158]MDX1890022.1 DUF732 domain-containing protein [Mycolicibacterium sp. 050158]